MINFPLVMIGCDQAGLLVEVSIENRPRSR
jgi:hypothetical protein